jgi:hypothetical protein
MIIVKVYDKKGAESKESIKYNKEQKKVFHGTIP